MHNNQSQEAIDTRYFPRGNHKGENPATSLEIEWAPIAKVKSKNTNMIFWQQLSLSLIPTSSLSLMRPSLVSVCVEMRRASILFIFFLSLYVHSNKSASLNNYLWGSNSLGESNNPSAPQLWGLFPQSTRRVNLNSIMGTIAPNYNGGLTSLTLHDFIILMTLPIGTSGYNIRYASEYILKLQIHQQSITIPTILTSETSLFPKV